MNKQMVVFAAVFVLAIGCSKQEVKEARETTETAAAKAAEKVEDAIDVAVPLGRDDPAAREKERFDEQWRALSGFASVKSGPSQGPAAPEVNVTFVPNGKESFKTFTTPDSISNAPV